jgi:hypothetical protein
MKLNLSLPSQRTANDSGNVQGFSEILSLLCTHLRVVWDSDLDDFKLQG